jgi:hypothetical protein
MKPERIALVEHVVRFVGFIAVVVAVGAFDPRAGLLLAGVILVASTIDFRWRRP